MIEKGYVYFIESISEYHPTDILILKIGRVGKRQSYNKLIYNYDVGKIIYRKRELQTASPFDLKYLALLRITSNVGRAERYIHSHISELDYVTKMRGEWYSIARRNFDKLLIDIKSMVNNSQSDNSYYIDINQLDDKIGYAEDQVKKELAIRKSVKKYYNEHGYHPKYNKELKSFIFD